jgi:lipopolysaccharide/colanic/teichoic acid biosynthesis glycosyltransferase
MIENPAEYWQKAVESGTVEAWARRARRKVFVWKKTVKLLRYSKRLLDIVGSSFALLIFSPVFLMVSLLIKLEDRGPIFFKQQRVGEGGKLFGMWKFRSMVQNADKLKDQLLDVNQHGTGAVTFKMKNDPRITKIGKWLRKLSIDEFPQFYNVLKGEMSLVGPRPPVPREVAAYKAMHLRRLKAVPGITCLWQIGGRAEIDFEGQVRLDLQYIRSASPLTDLLILVKTVPAVLFGKGAY